MSTASSARELGRWRFDEHHQQRLTPLQGWSNPAVEFFAGERAVALVRECVQNSLDHQADGEQVSVSFAWSDVSAQVVDADGLWQHFVAACDGHPDQTGDTRGQTEALRAATVETGVVPCMVLTDHGTTGAPDVALAAGQLPPWERLTNSEGYSLNEGDQIGSYGIGKHAAFAATPARTVLYSTLWRDADSIDHFRFRGRCILADHVVHGSSYGAHGYLGTAEGMSITNASDAPDIMSIPDPGVRLLIPWCVLNRPLDVLHVIAEHYAVAVLDDNLTVRVDGLQPEVVDSGTLRPEGAHYSQLRSSSSGRSWIDAYVNGEQRDTEVSGVGAVALHMLVHDDPSDRRLALVRHPGIVINHDRQMLDDVVPKRWREVTQGFVAVLKVGPLGDHGSESWIRAAESPRHNELSRGRIQDPIKQRKAKVAFKSVNDWVRAQVKEIGSSLASEKVTSLDELMQYDLVVRTRSGGQVFVNVHQRAATLRPSKKDTDFNQGYAPARPPSAPAVPGGGSHRPADRPSPHPPAAPSPDHRVTLVRARKVLPLVVLPLPLDTRRNEWKLQCVLLDDKLEAQDAEYVLVDIQREGADGSSASVAFHDAQTSDYGPLKLGFATGEGIWMRPEDLRSESAILTVRLATTVDAPAFTGYVSRWRANPRNESKSSDPEGSEA